MEQTEIKKYTTFKIGGQAKAIHFPTSVDEFIHLLKNIESPLVLGAGSNILASSLGIEEEVIFTTQLKNYEVEVHIILCAFYRNKTSPPQVLRWAYVVTIPL